MRHSLSQDPTRYSHPESTRRTHPEATRRAHPESVRSFGDSLAASALVAAVTVAVVLAASYPVAATGAAAFAVAGWLAARSLGRSYRHRQRAGRTRRVCVPKTGVCVEV
jgi:hypothetical protein